MTTPHPNATLDAILAVQLTVAWAGEGRSEPKRLGWWDTDLIDPAGGGDFLARLAPRTHAWAGLRAVREAARRVDEKARKRLADPDALRTLFSLGFELDEQLDDRLAELEKSGHTPADTLPLQLKLSADFSKSALEKLLTQHGAEPHTVVPGGRQLRGTAPANPIELVHRLAAGLVPITETYPLPFFKVSR